METVIARTIEWGAASRPLGAVAESGDQHLVKGVPYGVLIAAVDGLGHGREAAEAALTAVQTIRANSQEAVIPLVRRCHEALQTTRGVVLSLASFNAADGTMTWLGVGNVEGVLVRADEASGARYERLTLRGGVVGAQLPPLAAEIVALSTGDTLIFATDGIKNDFAQDAWLAGSAQEVADRILALHARGTDDALVVVVRYLGPAS